MNRRLYQVPAHQLNAYQMVEKTTITGRDTEARVLTQCAIKLKHCKENWNAKDRKVKLDEALRYNQKIWSLIQGDILDNNNPLPKNIRNDILSLSAFLDKRIFNIMAYPAPEKLNIVIDINLNIAAGLRSSAGISQA